MFHITIIKKLVEADLTLLKKLEESEDTASSVSKKAREKCLGLLLGFLLDG
jgi:hypothetical protein